MSRNVSWDRRRLVLPILLSGVVLAIGPFLGVLRDWLLLLFPRALLTGLGGAFALALLGALGLALARIRDRRLTRFGGVVLSMLMVGVQLGVFGTGNSEVDVVERFHIVEYGMLAVLFQRALGALGGGGVALALVATALVGVADEWIQALVSTRVGDVRDVGLNCAAALAGTVFAMSVFPSGRRLASGWDRVVIGRLALLGALLVGTFAAFFDRAHLGAELAHGDEATVFVSWLSAADLASAAADRATRWQAGQRPQIAPWRMEDRFLTAGVAHVAHRNFARQHGHNFVAWREQRILERYYAPVLTLHGRREGEPFTLPAAEREALRLDAARYPQREYRSPVLRERVVLWPSRWWWGGAGAVALTLTFAGVLLLRTREASSGVPSSGT